ncbi:MAG: hypothetical protein WC558_08185 [Patulibacter sp.]
MKKLLVLSAAGVLAFVPASATAETPSGSGIAVKLAKGKTVSYTAGKLRVKTGKRTVPYAVDAKTVCSYGDGVSGGIIRCSHLSKRKYLSRSVRVAWLNDSKKRRVARVVAVEMPKKK